MKEKRHSVGSWRSIRTPGERPNNIFKIVYVGSVIIYHVIGDVMHAQTLTCEDVRNALEVGV